MFMRSDKLATRSSFLDDLLEAPQTQHVFLSLGKPASPSAYTNTYILILVNEHIPPYSLNTTPLPFTQPVSCLVLSLLAQPCQWISPVFLFSMLLLCSIFGHLSTWLLQWPLCLQSLPTLSHPMYTLVYLIFLKYISVPVTPLLKTSMVLHSQQKSKFLGLVLKALHHVAQSHFSSPTSH